MPTAPIVAARTSTPTPLASPADTPPADAPRTSGERHAVILVVERDPHVRELEAYFLEEAGYHVEFAGDGAAALELVRRVNPDIVITEVLVPKLDGLALCRKLKEDPSTNQVAVLVFSILAAGGRARDAGADAFLMKPLAERRLVDTVRELVAARRTPHPTSGATAAPSHETA